MSSTANNAAEPAPQNQAHGGIIRTPLESYQFSPDFAVISSVVEVAAGTSAEPHIHPGYEIGYLLGGSATIVVPGKSEVPLEAGGMYKIPANAVHFARVGTTEPLKALSIFVVDKNAPISTISDVSGDPETIENDFVIAASPVFISGGLGERPHSHPGIETGYVVEGEGLLEVRGTPSVQLKPGSSYTVPAGAIHSILPLPGAKQLHLFVAKILSKGQTASTFY